MSVAFQNVTVPRDGAPILMSAGKLQVPDQPVIPFIEGDGTGPDIWRASVRVFDAAVARAYGVRRKIAWCEVFAGEKAFRRFNTWLPDDSVRAFEHFRVGIKGPLTTPVGGGIRSLNVELRQRLDLYVCLRPVRYFKGVPSPVKRPERVDMVIFRENTEDIYAGIEWPMGSADAGRVLAFLEQEFPKDFKKIRFATKPATNEWAAHFEKQATDHPVSVAIGVKPVSGIGSGRLIHAAITYALKNGRRSVTLVHKGNIMKFTEGGFKDVGYACAAAYFRNETVTERESWILANHDQDATLADEANARMIEPGFDMMSPDQQAKIIAEVQAALKLRPTHGDGRWKSKLRVKDAIADIVLQQVLTRPEDFDVFATLNLNGDYLSDALAAQVGGIGIAPGGNINYISGHAIFEATHGTAPRYANQDKVNPGSVILSGELMLRYLGWTEAADLIIRGMGAAIAARQVTYDFHRLMEAEGTSAKLLKCSEFADAVIRHMA